MVGFGDIAAWAGVGVALLAGVTGVVFGVKGNRRAKEADEKAETANRIAVDALGEARKANDIAEHANQLSEQANTITGRSVAQQEEDWFVDWDPQWDDEKAVLTLKNTGSHPALEPSVTVAGNDLHNRVDGHHDIPPGEQISVPLPQIPDQRSKHTAEQATIREQLRNAGFTYFGSSFHTNLKVTVRCKSSLGLPHIRELHIDVN